MSEKAPAFQWYPKDCDTDENVKAMDDREFGFYVRCLNHSWLNHGLPSDLGELARVMGRRESYVSRVWTRVGKCFEEHGDRLFNPRQEKDRRHAVEVSVERSQAGRKGNANRWQKPRNCDSFAIANHRSPSPTPSAITPPTPSFDFEEGFSAVWSAYPTKGRTRRPDAERWYVEAVTPDPERIHGEILAGIRDRWHDSKLWADGYVASLAEFLRLHRWSEEPARIEVSDPPRLNLYTPPKPVGAA